MTISKVENYEHFLNVVVFDLRKYLNSSLRTKMTAYCELWLAGLILIIMDSNSDWSILFTLSKYLILTSDWSEGSNSHTITSLYFQFALSGPQPSAQLFLSSFYALYQLSNLRFSSSL